MKKTLFGIIVGIFFIFFGFIIMVIDFSKYELITEKIDKKSTVTVYGVPEGRKLNFNCDYCNMRTVVDETLTNRIEVHVMYPDQFYTYQIEDNIEGKVQNVSIRMKDIEEKSFYQLLIQDLKNEKVRNYFNDLQMDVEIYTSKDNLDLIEIED